MRKYNYEHNAPNRIWRWNEAAQCRSGAASTRNQNARLKTDLSLHAAYLFHVELDTLWTKLDTFHVKLEAFNLNWTLFWASLRVWYQTEHLPIQSKLPPQSINIFWKNWNNFLFGGNLEWLSLKFLTSYSPIRQTQRVKFYNAFASWIKVMSYKFI